MSKYPVSSNDITLSLPQTLKIGVQRQWLSITKAISSLEEVVIGALELTDQEIKALYVGILELTSNRLRKARNIHILGGVQELWRLTTL